MLSVVEVKSWVLSLLRKMVSDSAVLTSVRSLFHHWGGRTEKSRDFAGPALFALDGGTSWPADVGRAKCSSWGVRSDQCLEVDGCSSVNGLEGQHHRPESDTGRKRKKKWFYNPDLIWLLSPVWSSLNGWKTFWVNNAPRECLNLLPDVTEKKFFIFEFDDFCIPNTKVVLGECRCDHKGTI